MAQRWRSLASRFTKQVQFKVMSEYATKVRRERARTQQKFRDLWQILADKLMLETRIAGFSRAKAITEHYLGLWQGFAEETLLNARITIMKNVHRRWTSRPWKSEQDVQRVWMAFARRLKHNWRALSYLQTSVALRRITTFVQYVMIPRRAKVVALSFKPAFVAFGRNMAKQQVIGSFGTLKNAFRHHLRVVAQNFADDWGGCITDACCAVAAYHVGNPEEIQEVVLPKRPEKPKPPPVLDEPVVKPKIKAAAYPTKVVRIEALEESDPPLQLDFGDEYRSLPRAKSPIKAKVRIIEDSCERAKTRPQNIEINIDPEYSQSSDDVYFAPDRKNLKISPPSTKEVKRHHHKSHRAPVRIPLKHYKKPPKRSIESILQRMGFTSDLEDLGTDESDLTELNFRFDDDPSTDPMHPPTHGVEMLSLIRHGPASSGDFSIASYEQSSFTNPRETAIDDLPQVNTKSAFDSDHVASRDPDELCGIRFEAHSDISSIASD